jgi:hypothetical protein
VKKSRFSDEKIIGILRKGEAAAKAPELCRRHACESTGRAANAYRLNNETPSNSPSAIPGDKRSAYATNKSDSRF